LKNLRKVSLSRRLWDLILYEACPDFIILQDTMPIKAKSVAVIGAGPAGAIATDALVKEQAFDTIRVFDRRPIVGGTW
jgi:NADPH-dependent 2,4-dienoyl-CoA reductase/sulfur reductase-like enzyme